MIDSRIRPLIDPPLNRAGAVLAGYGLTANTVTLAGFAIGMSSVPLLAMGRYDLALIVILINRLMDGLDGAIAKQVGITDLGGYLDIVLDFIFYAAVVFGFALAEPRVAVHAAFLIFSFVGTGSSFLAYAILAAKHNISTDIQGKKSLYYLGGLTEGAETIAVFVVICLFPEYFAWIAVIFGCLCWITTGTRVAYTYRQFQASD
jgi:phosphatidylglycerophosphate synthase